MCCREWINRLPKVCLAALALGTTAGCFIPGGGWTLRTGLDWRTHAKPGAYLELVDTRWDEWNRVAQMNAMMETAVPVYVATQPVPATNPPEAQPAIQEPYPVPPAAGIPGDVTRPPRIENDLQGKRTTRSSGRLQVAEGRTTVNSVVEDDVPDQRVTQSTWRRPGKSVDEPLSTKSDDSKTPPGGWLFRGVRRSNGSR